MTGSKQMFPTLNQRKSINRFRFDAVLATSLIDAKEHTKEGERTDAIAYMWNYARPTHVANAGLNIRDLRD